MNDYRGMNCGIWLILSLLDRSVSFVLFRVGSFSFTSWSMSSESADNVSEEQEIVFTVPDNDVYRPEVDTSGIDERRLMRRIDWHVVPWLAILYLLNFLDRGSIGNARVSSFYSNRLS